MLDKMFLVVVMITLLEEILRVLLGVAQVVAGLTAGGGVEGGQLLRGVSSPQRTIPSMLNHPWMNKEGWVRRNHEREVSFEHFFRHFMDGVCGLGCG